jgi:carbon-monoxide dehydrogenase medium subunit
MRKPFQYLRPATPQEAVEMKAAHGARAIYWAGGTDLVLLWQRGEVSPDYCIDLTFLCDLDYIVKEAGEMRIGALASLDALDRASGMNRLAATLGYTSRLMCTPQTRTIATVGGNLCNASPAADLSPLFVALDSIARIRGNVGERSVPMERFFRGVNETALEGEEMLVEVAVPVPAERREACYQRVARTVVDIALVSAAVSVTATDGHVGDARIALGSVAPVPIRCRAAEDLLRGAELARLDAALLAEAGELAAREARAISDVRAGKAYRQKMCAVLTRRALGQSVERLRGGAS